LGENLRARKHIFLSSNLNSICFYGVRFSSPLALDDVMLNMLRNHMYYVVGGKHVKVSSPIGTLLMLH
jgi:hypothetical protein